jgi:hypothetical protein
MSEMMVWQLLGFGALAMVIVVMFVRQSRMARELHARVDLPVLREDKGPPRCETCTYFDLEEGQAQLHAHQAFSQVTNLVSPALMSQEVIFDDRGNALVDDKGDAKKTEPSVPHKTQWGEVGACAHHNEGRFKKDHCPSYTPRPEGAEDLAYSNLGNRAVGA